MAPVKFPLPSGAPHTSAGGNRRRSRILVPGGPVEFWPQGGPWAQNLLIIRGFPLKLPENCKILKKSWGQGGWPGPPGSVSGQTPFDHLNFVSWNSAGLCVLTSNELEACAENTDGTDEEVEADEDEDDTPDVAQDSQHLPSSVQICTNR